MKVYADADRLIAAARRAFGNGATDKAESKLRTYLRRQPRAPRVISRRGAAELLGIRSPHIARLQAQGRMPEPLDVDEGAPVWLREDIEKLAAELQAEREQRAKARRERTKQEEAAA